MADKKGTGLLMVFVDVPADKEEDFNRWYNEEHIPELLTIPGVLNAARYEAVKSGPKHLACYELENPAVVDSDGWTKRTRSEWALRVGPQVIGSNFLNPVFEVIRPATLTPEVAQSGMAPALQIGRMDIPAEHEAEWNEWYNNVYTANFEKVAGCIRARRLRGVKGDTGYGVIYEFENEKVSEQPEWLEQQKIGPNNARMRSLMRHAPMSPGIWKMTFQL
tara:strand:+ start:3219 stop:3878 length:660 start_codon:yes stop_codon:yes gene_type:complete